MKLVYSDIDYVFDTNIDKVNTLIIENQPLFLSFLTDLQRQIMGLEGKTIISLGDKILDISKSLIVLDRFIPFDMNERSLITKITTDLEKKAISDDYYAKTIDLVGQIDSFFNNLAFDYSCDIQFSKINIGSFIKASGVEICDNYDRLGEKIIDYFQLINEFIGEKLFITINLRSYISDKEAELFVETVLSHGFHVIMVENFEHLKLINENRLIVDADLCLIS